MVLKYSPIMSVSAKEKAEELLSLPLDELLYRADEVRSEFVGKRLELCSILNARSGLCGEDCKFCAQSSRHRTGIETYPLKSKAEIVEAAEKAEAIGAEKFGIVTSGNRLSKKELESVAEAISEIKEKVEISVCGSLGALGREELEVLKEAGLSRYHHNIETSRRYYPEIVSTHSFDERISTIKNAKEAGLEVCSGGIIGMGESWADRIDMACTLKELGVDSVPINILIPIKGTALEGVEVLGVEDVLRAISIFRIILGGVTIKIAAGREAVLKDEQAKGFMAGANGMLIGGYLTVKGGGLEADYALIEEINRLWNE